MVLWHLSWKQMKWIWIVFDIETEVPESKKPESNLEFKGNFILYPYSVRNSEGFKWDNLKLWHSHVFQFQDDMKLLLKGIKVRQHTRDSQ